MGVLVGLGGVRVIWVKGVVGMDGVVGVVGVDGQVGLVKLAGVDLVDGVVGEAGVVGLVGVDVGLIGKIPNKHESFVNRLTYECKPVKSRKSNDRFNEQ